MADWVLSNNSNVHVARDRAWFSTYKPFQTFAVDNYIFGQRINAVGIGDVHLPVKLFPKRSGAGAHGTLHLRNVLHVPSTPCNIVAGCGHDDFHSAQLGGLGDNGDDGAIRAGTLSGPPLGPVLGPSSLGTDHFMLSLSWPDTERRRWEATRRGTQSGSTPGSSSPNLGGLTLSGACWPAMQSNHGPAGAQNGPSRMNRPSEPAVARAQAVSADGKGKGKAEVPLSPPYSKAEKHWLKRHWGGEFKFLSAHGLSIYDDEDRDEGRWIARAMMEADEGPDAGSATGRSSGFRTGMSDGRFPGWKDGDEPDLEDVVNLVQGHFADYNFSDKELDFIESGWGNSETFMLSHGLKFYNNEDCEKAKAIVKVLMAEEDSD